MKIFLIIAINLRLGVIAGNYLVKKVSLTLAIYVLEIFFYLVRLLAGVLATYYTNSGLIVYEMSLKPLHYFNHLSFIVMIFSLCMMLFLENVIVVVFIIL